jgi:D-alanyl-D-alanine endopeptidase (penicillin-binding protein 7)
VALIGSALAPPLSAGGPGGIELASVHAVVGDLESGEVLYAKRDDVAVPIASVTKLMTAMVVLDAEQSLEESISIVGWGRSVGKNGFSRLRVGSESTRGQLVRLALMSSDNLAAWTLAQHYAGGLEACIAAMNEKARALGMSRTHFDDPTGLAPSNRSSASDLWQLVRAAYGYEKIREYSTTTQYTATFREPTRTLGYGNTNPLTFSSRWEIGLSKTGYLDEAGRCLVMVAAIDGRRIGIVLLNSFGTRTPQGDAARVRRWLETGSSGRVALDALEYERRVAKAYDDTGEHRAHGAH